MGTGTYDSYWMKPPDTPSLRELEQLRVLAMYEFEPPLSSQELAGALRACDNSTEDAYQYLKASRRHQRAIAIPASAPAATNTDMTMPEREKRRLSASTDDNGTPNKRHKDLSFSLMDSQEKTEEEEDKDTTPDTQQDSEMLSTTADCTRAQQLLTQTVEDRVAARQPLRNPDWVNQVWSSLQVPAVLELAMHLNLTVDALATWVKDAETQNAKDIQTQGVALTVEVAASLPPYSPDANDSVAYLPKDEVLTKKDDEVAAVAKAENQDGEMSACARANATKSAIECLSSACKANMDRLGWFAKSYDKEGEEKREVEEVLEILSQKLTGLVDKCTRDVKEAECRLLEAKQTKETRSLQIVDFVHKRHKELLDEGESEASATLQSVVDVWKKDDVEVQDLWKSRSDSERRVKEAACAFKVAEHALTFHKNLSILFRKVRERREEALTSSSKTLEEARATSEVRAIAALENFIPILTRALGRYYEFHSIKQSKAKAELHEQKKALKAHDEYFGDSAPIKKGDIEQRIREFIGVTQGSMQEIMEIAEVQQQLWEDKQAILSESVRHVLIREFKALWLQLSGPMQDVMKKFVTTIEEAAGGVVAVEPPKVHSLLQLTAMQEPTVPLFVAPNALDEQVIPAFTVPVFTNSYAESVTPYRTAISPIVASNEIATCSSSSKVEEERASGPAQSTEKVGPTSATAASSLPQVPRKPRHEFAVGSTLFSKITVGEQCTQFVRGVVLKQLDNDMYLMQYDSGDKFSVGSSFLFTKELMEQNVKAGGVAAPDEDTEMEDASRAEHKPSEGGCAIM